MSDFDKAFELVIAAEGGYSNDAALNNLFDNIVDIFLSTIYKLTFLK